MFERNPSLVIKERKPTLRNMSGRIAGVAACAKVFTWEPFTAGALASSHGSGKMNGVSLQ
jgi:hypothetical protein